MNLSTSQKLPEIGEKFCRGLAAVTADILKEIPVEDRDGILAYLQDQTSLYSPYTADLIHEALE